MVAQTRTRHRGHQRRAVECFGRGRLEMSAFELVHRTTKRSAKRRYNFHCVRGSNRRISVVRARGVAACFQRGVLRNEHVGGSGMIAESQLNSLDGVSSDFDLGRSEGDEAREKGFAIGGFCGGTLLMPTLATTRKPKARGAWQLPSERMVMHAGRGRLADLTNFHGGESLTQFDHRPLRLPESASAVWLGSRPQDSRLDASDRWLRLLDFTRFPRQHSENREAIALRMRRALEHVRAKAEFTEPHLSRSDERQRRVLIGSHRARANAVTTCLRWLAEASSLHSSRLCLSDAPAVPRGAARRDRRQLRSSPPQLSRAALSEARTVRGVASRPG